MSAITPTSAAKPEGERIVRLDHFLKVRGLSETGGGAKVAIQGGDVQVNGAVETRRKRKLRVGDVVRVGEREETVDAGDVR